MPKNLYRRGATWWARVRVCGREERRSLRTADLREARARLKALLADATQRRAGGLAPEAAPTWQEAVVRWSALQMRGLRPATQNRYALSLRMLDPFLRDKRVTEITGRVLSGVAAARAAAGAAPATIRRDLAVVSRVLDVARSEDWIAVNPVPAQKRMLKEMREPVRPVPTRHVVLLVRAARQVDRGRRLGMADLARFLWREGCRQEEAAGMEWADLALDAATGTGTLTLGRTKTRSPRVIVLRPQTVRDLLRFRPPNARGLVFRTKDGGRFTQLGTRFAALIGGLGLGAARFRCHDLRHTMAIRALQGRVDGEPWGIYRLARHLGHADVRTTQIYTGWLARAPE